MGVCPVLEQVRVSSVLGLAMGVLGWLGPPLQRQLGLMARENVSKEATSQRAAPSFSILWG